jgi:glycosyltransferase involved in cell wall biosynthesis
MLMKVLLCHNHYQQPGGEDQSFAAEARMLEDRGHEVIRYTLHNDAIDDMRRWDVARRTVWNPEVYHTLRRLIRHERPDVVHTTNTFPLLSPAACYAARAEGVPVVQALRNYRLLCPNALLMRQGQVCEECLGKFVPWPAVVHSCYRDDRAASAVVAGMLTAHRALRTWTRKVSLFFTLTEFARQKLIEGGLPAKRIVVKPNFIDPDPGPGLGRGSYAVFVGRLSPEKGVTTLLAAWERLASPLPLKVVGDGPQAELVRQAASRDPRIAWLGRRSPEEVLRILGDAAFLVMPSVWYETFGRTIIEAFAKGTPALVSRLGAMAELVTEGRNGLLFEAGNPADLAAKAARLLEDPELHARLRREARREFEQKYTAETNYRMLLAIYERASHKQLSASFPNGEET